MIRHNFKLAVYDLHKEQYEFISYLKNGLTLSEAKAKFKEEHPNNVTQFDQVWDNWKTRWIQAKLFRV